jgi:MFS transporter, FHS family, L-fucose permease
MKLVSWRARPYSALRGWSLPRLNRLLVGGDLLPKLMGAITDHYNMFRGFIVPMICFVFIAFYGYAWPKLSRGAALHGVDASSGH